MQICKKPTGHSILNSERLNSFIERLAQGKAIHFYQYHWGDMGILTLLKHRMKKLFMNWKGNLKMYLIKYNLIVHVKISWTLHKTSRKWWEFSNVFRYKLNIQISIVFLIINSEQISLKCVLKSREFRIVKIVLKKNKVGIVTCFYDFLRVTIIKTSQH